MPHFYVRRGHGGRRRKRAWPYWLLGLFLLWVAAGIWTSVKPMPDAQRAIAALANAGGADHGEAVAATDATGAAPWPGHGGPAEPAITQPETPPQAQAHTPPPVDTIMMVYATPAPTTAPTPVSQLTLIPTPAVEQEQVRYGKTAASGVNLRSQPTTDATALRINRIDTPLKVLASTFNSIGEEWHKVLYGEFEGYIRCDLVILIPQGEYEALLSSG